MRPVSHDARVRAFVAREILPASAYQASTNGNRPVYPACNVCASSGANGRGDYEACPECGGTGLIDRERTNRSEDYSRRGRNAHAGGVQEP